MAVPVGLICMILVYHLLFSKDQMSKTEWEQWPESNGGLKLAALCILAMSHSPH